jgi:hypothetical protein
VCDNVTQTFDDMSVVCMYVRVCIWFICLPETGVVLEIIRVATILDGCNNDYMRVWACKYAMFVGGFMHTQYMYT